MANLDIEITNNKDAVLSALREQVQRGLESIGVTAEGYAQENCINVDTGRLRNSISHAVEETEVQIGTNVEYAPYIEYGTGIYASEGGGRQTPWVYYNEKLGRWVWTRGIQPTHFLRDAVSQHSDEYNAIMEANLRA